MIALTLVERLDGWSLPLAGCPVISLCVDFALTLNVDHPAGAVAVRIEEPFVFVAPSGTEVRLSPEEDPAGLGPVLTCSRTQVHDLIAYTDGGLEVSFSDGATIRVPSSEEFEAWQLAGPDGLKIVSVPGGELTIWGRAPAESARD